MSENTSEDTNKTEPQAAGNEPAGKGGEQRPGGNPLPLVLSGIAVLLAALALIANQMGQPAPRIDPLDALNGKLGQIEARISDMQSQLTNDKLDVVNMQLKRILLDLEQLSALADNATRSKIDQAYRLLKPLSGPAVRVQAEVDLQSTVMPENQTQTEEPTATPEETSVPDQTAVETAPQTPPVSASGTANATMTEPAMQSLEPGRGETGATDPAPSSDNMPMTPGPTGDAGQADTLLEEAMPPIDGAFQGVSPGGNPAPHP